MPADHQSPCMLCCSYPRPIVHVLADDTHQPWAADACSGAGRIEAAKAVAAAAAHSPPAEGKPRRFASSWDAKEASAEAGSKEDYLSNLGTAQDYNINVSHGAQ